MKNPNIRTKVQHSNSKDAWNVVGTDLGKKYKIAVIPYDVDKHGSVMYNEEQKLEACNHAEFISFCFNKEFM